jgi:hypothetical protein
MDVRRISVAQWKVYACVSVDDHALEQFACDTMGPCWNDGEAIGNKAERCSATDGDHQEDSTIIRFIQFS